MCTSAGRLEDVGGACVKNIDKKSLTSSAAAIPVTSAEEEGKILVPFR